MSDRVRPQKMETSIRGTETDEFPTGLDPSEDHIEARGIFFQNDTSDDEAVHISRDASGNMTFEDDVVSGVKTLSDLTTGGSGLTEGSHEILDTLKHMIAEDGHQQITRSSGKVSNITVWTDSGETKKIRETIITRSSGKVSQIVVIQYDSDGAEKVRVTGTVTRASGRVDYIDWVETVA